MRGSLQAWAVVVVLAACGNVGGQDCVPSFLSGIGGFNGDPQTGPAYDIEIHNGVAYVAALYGGLFTVDVSDPASVSLLGSVETPDSARAVAVAGTVAYIADNTSGLQIIDVSDPSSPSILSSLPFFQSIDVAVEGTVVYVADSLGLQIVDVSDPLSPFVLGSFNTPGSAKGVVVADDVAYVADFDFGLQIIDVSNPAAPSLLGNFDRVGYAIDVAVAGNVAYVAYFFDGLQVVDVTNPKLPFLLGSVDTPGSAFGVVVDASVAFVSDFNFGVQVIDVANTAFPSLLTNLETPGLARKSTVVGSVLYVADDQSGLQVYDVGPLDCPGGCCLGDSCVDATVDECINTLGGVWGGGNACLDSNPCGLSDFAIDFRCGATVAVTAPVAVAVDFFVPGGGLDLAVASATDPIVTVLGNDGAGVFTTSTTIPDDMGATPTDIQSGNFVSGGGPDLVIARGSSPGTVYANDFGSFGFINESCDPECNCGAQSTPECPDPGCNCNWSVPGGETILILPALNMGRPTLVGIVSGAPAGRQPRLVGLVGSKVGDGSGGYRGSTDLQAVGNNPVAAAAADITNDGFEDLLVANLDDDSVDILIFEDVNLFGGNTTGGICWRNGQFDCPESTGLRAPTPLAVGNPPAAIAAGNLGGTSDVDVVVAVQNANELLIYFGNGDGTFQLPTSTPIPPDPRDLVAADLDNDSDLDLVLLSGGGGGNGLITVLINDGAGVFTAGPVISVGMDPREIVVVDLLGDSLPDIVVVEFGSDSVTIFENGPETCPADGDRDGTVGINDFLALLAMWGPCTCPCPADIDGDGTVGINDFLTVLAQWGPC